MAPALHFSDDGARSLCGLKRPFNWMSADGIEGNGRCGSRLCGNCQQVQRMKEWRDRGKSPWRGATLESKV